MLINCYWVVVKMARKLVVPCIQVALDNVNENETMRVCEQLPRDQRIILEAGTPLIKQCGIGIVRRIKQASGNAFVVADLKTLDVGALEVQIAGNGGADAAICAGVAGIPTIDSFVAEARKQGVMSFVDMMNVADARALLKGLKQLPDGVSLHRGIDAEVAGARSSLDAVKKLKSDFPSLKVAVAGGMDDKTAREAVKAGADVVVVGRFITGAQDPAQEAMRVLGSFE